MARFEFRLQIKPGQARHSHFRHDAICRASSRVGRTASTLIGSARFGWREIEVIDNDLGRSAAGAVVRAEFEHMVAEVWLGNAGAVAAREVSRFARNRVISDRCRIAHVVSSRIA